jgi:hypothetical protein
MDFFETFFGISPDGGSGATEVLLCLVLVALFAAIVLPYHGISREVLAAGSSTDSSSPPMTN